MRAWCMVVVLALSLLAAGAAGAATRSPAELLPADVGLYAEMNLRTLADYQAGDKVAARGLRA